MQKFTVQARTSAGSTELDEFTSDLYKFHGVRASRGDVASTRVRFSNVAVETFDLWTYWNRKSRSHACFGSRLFPLMTLTFPLIAYAMHLLLLFLAVEYPRNRMEEITGLIRARSGQHQTSSLQMSPLLVIVTRWLSRWSVIPEKIQRRSFFTSNVMEERIYRFFRYNNKLFFNNFSLGWYVSSPGCFSFFFRLTDQGIVRVEYINGSVVAICKCDISQSLDANALQLKIYNEKRMWDSKSSRNLLFRSYDLSY